MGTSKNSISRWRGSCCRIVSSAKKACRLFAAPGPPLILQCELAQHWRIQQSIRFSFASSRKISSAQHQNAVQSPAKTNKSRAIVPFSRSDTIFRGALTVNGTQHLLILASPRPKSSRQRQFSPNAEAGSAKVLQKNRKEINGLCLAHTRKLCYAMNH